MVQPHTRGKSKPCRYLATMAGTFAHQPSDLMTNFAETMSVSTDYSMTGRVFKRFS